MSYQLYPDRKKCNTCGEVKDKSCFGHRHQRFDGLNNDCHKCVHENIEKSVQKEKKRILDNQLFSWDNANAYGI